MRINLNNNKGKSHYLRTIIISPASLIRFKIIFITISKIDANKSFHAFSEHMRGNKRIKHDSPKDKFVTMIMSNTKIIPSSIWRVHPCCSRLANLGRLKGRE